jgi:hypothetical protein
VKAEEIKEAKETKAVSPDTGKDGSKSSPKRDASPELDTKKPQEEKKADAQVKETKASSAVSDLKPVPNSNSPGSGSPATEARTFDSELKQLADMGFTDQSLCLSYLRLKNGDLQKVVQLLLAGPIKA